MRAIPSQWATAAGAFSSTLTIVTILLAPMTRAGSVRWPRVRTSLRLLSAPASASTTKITEWRDGDGGREAYEVSVLFHTPYHVTHFSVGETEGRNRFEFHTNFRARTIHAGRVRSRHARTRSQWRFGPASRFIAGDEFRIRVMNFA